MRNRYAPAKMEAKRGLALVSDNYINLNSSILKIKFPGMKTSQKLDQSGRNFIIVSELNGAPVLDPVGIAVNRYFDLRRRLDWHTKFVEVTLAKPAESVAGGDKLELIGADIAGQHVALRVSGNVNINGRLQSQNSSQVHSTYSTGTSTSFVVDQKQQLNIEGKIGDRISILVDQDSERDFDFENNLKIIYTGKEDDIVQKVEAGNISLSLPSTQYVTFSGTNSGLYGFKSLMQFGGINVTAIASVEKGKKEKLSVDGGAQTSKITIKDSDYRKNIYFYLDYHFRENMYQGYTNYGVFTVDSRGTVADLKVYKSQTIETAGCIRGMAFVDPRDTTLYPQNKVNRIFKLLELNKDYITDESMGYLKMAAQLQDGEVLAVAYRIIDPKTKLTVDGEEYGDYARTDTSSANYYILKLIKPETMQPSHPCWDLEMKNIYNLGTTGIEKEGFDLDIYYTQSNSDLNYDPVTGKRFIQLFGLDKNDDNNTGQPNGVIDLNDPYIINLFTGELWFPFLRPFQYDSLDATGTRNPNLSQDYNCSAMYDSNRTDINDINNDSKFKILVSYQNRSSILSLGAMVIENSESVTLNSVPLTRNVDYTIDYFSGTLTLLNKDATNPDANLEVKYEKNQFFQLDKKTILGARAQYDFGDNGFIGGTALYYSQSVTDEKVEVGYEPYRNFVWDINGKYKTKLDFLTRAINWLPLIKTNAESSIDIEGEIAQVVPTVNTLSNEDTGDMHGVGFIDDFESSERVTAPPIMRRYWTRSSLPYAKYENQRGHTIWYNPYASVATTSIWPDKEVSTTAQNTTTEVLVLRVEPNWSVDYVDGNCSVRDVWGGITYSFPQSYYDQSNSKYMDIWVKGHTGTLHIDLGDISEDQNSDGIINTEDLPEGLSTGNGLLDEDKEDTGLDGLWDKDEKVITATDTLKYGDEALRNYGRDPYDPHSDNWKYSEGSRDYSKVNGTEGNANDASNGLYPDTEDLDNDYSLDATSDYFTASFDLADEGSIFKAGETFISGKSTGWKLYRIPLTAFSKTSTGKDVTWENIKACRLWLDGLDKRDSLYIAQIELVGNEWEELGVAASDTSSFVENEETFTMSVINTEDNPDIYEPPDGVLGEYDQVTQTRAKEQSLVLELPEEGVGLQAGELCASKKVLMEETSYITYKEMKLYVYGGEDLTVNGSPFMEGDETPLQFFIRFGKISDKANTTSYYEYRQPVFYSKWRSENEMQLDLDFMTTLKLYNSENEYSGDGEFRIDTNVVGVTIRHYKELDQDGQYTGKELIIYGSPSLASIKRIDIGLRNRSDNTNCANAFRTGTIKGQVWLDELRLSEVRSDKGMAYRAKTSLKMADLASFDLVITHKDADFHTVEQRSSLTTDNLITTRAVSATGKVNLDKVTPPSWGLTIPVIGTYSQSTGTRKYVYGSDILMEDNPADSLLDIAKSYGVNASFSKRASDYWLTKYTIDQIQVNMNATWSEKSTVTIRESKSENYKASVSYQFPFPKNKFVSPLKWTAKIPILGDKISETHFYYWPTNLSVSADAGKGTSHTIQRATTDIQSGNNFDLNRSLTFGYKMLDNLNANYTLNTTNNLIELWNRQWEIFQSINPGKMENYRETYSASFTPKIFKWFSPSFNYSAAFNWSEPLSSPTKYIDILSNQRRISTTFSLDLATIFTSFFKSATAEAAKPATSGGRQTRRPGPPGDQPPGPEQLTDSSPPETPQTAPSRRRPGTKPAVDEKRPAAPADELTDKTPFIKPEGVKKSSEWSKSVAKYLKKIQTINVSLSSNNSISNRYCMGMPDIMYRLGLSDDPGLAIDSSQYVATSMRSLTQSLDGSIRSGLSLFANVNMPLSYSQNMSISHSQSTISRTFSRDYIPMGTKGRDGFPFPGWSLTWSQLEKYALFAKIFKKLSLDHGFSGKESITFQNGKELNSSYKLLFQPLIGLSMQFPKDISATVRVTGGQTINNTSSGSVGGTTIIDDAAVSATVNWQKKGGLTIPLPFLKDKRLENALTFTANFDYSTSQTRARNDNVKKFGVTARSKAWKTTPRINYTFSKKVTGGLFFEYGENDNKNTGRRITRNYGFDVNIAIRG